MTSVRAVRTNENTSGSQNPPESSPLPPKSSIMGSALGYVGENVCASLCVSERKRERDRKSVV